PIRIHHPDGILRSQVDRFVDQCVLSWSSRGIRMLRSQWTFNLTMLAEDAPPSFVLSAFFSAMLATLSMTPRTKGSEKPATNPRSPRAAQAEVARPTVKTPASSARSTQSAD